MIFAQAAKVTNEQLMARMNQGIHDLNTLKGWIALLVLADLVVFGIVAIQIIVKVYETRRVLIALAKLEVYADVATRHGKMTDEKAHEMAVSADSMKRSAKQVEDTVKQIPIVAMTKDPESGEAAIPVMKPPVIVLPADKGSQ